MAMNKAKELVSTNSVVVFSKTFCPYCTKVKQLLNQLGAKYIVVELDTEKDGNENPISVALCGLDNARCQMFSSAGTILGAVTKPQACTRKESWFLFLLMLELLPKQLLKGVSDVKCPALSLEI
uniref:Glutaredoxin domain-containing protein n=1 Tax=Salix viminalis TaxID=40686 RepID=A0A6N2M6B8_SALVM